jgi:hypothetical protein
MCHRDAGTVLIAVLSVTPAAMAGVTEFEDRAAWEAAVGAFTTITFTEIPVNQFVTTQYAHLGVTFTDGNDYTDASSAYVNDGFGLDGYPNSPISLSLATPQSWIAVDFPGFVQLELFRSGTLIFASSAFGVGGVGNFGGVLSNEAFDAVRITNPFVPDLVTIDDLHFGVPAPGGLALLAVSGAWTRRRRIS